MHAHSTTAADAHATWTATAPAHPHDHHPHVHTHAPPPPHHTLYTHTRALTHAHHPTRRGCACAAFCSPTVLQHCVPRRAEGADTTRVSDATRHSVAEEALHLTELEPRQEGAELVLSLQGGEGGENRVQQARRGGPAPVLWLCVQSWRLKAARTW